ncbi:MAG: hypothetical protein HYV42_01685 [Candidatus Magasanikbacteria bacterium]|nr:hypothetical protein [Candidatus Magasanikbacteria bacterium]
MDNFRKIIGSLLGTLMMLTAAPALAGTTPVGSACTVDADCVSPNVCTGSPKVCTAPSTSGPLQATDLLNVGTRNIGSEIGLGTTDVRITIAKIIRVAMGLLGIVAVVIVLIGGFTWMTAGGNEEKVGEAKKWIWAGIIGLAIILSAYAIASFVITQLIQATTQP